MVALTNDGLTTGCCNCNIKQNISNNRHSFTKIVKKHIYLPLSPHLARSGLAKPSHPARGEERMRTTDGRCADGMAMG